MFFLIRYGPCNSFYCFLLYNVYDGDDDDTLSFFNKMKNKTNFNNCGTQNPEDIRRERLPSYFFYLQSVVEIKK